MPSRYLPLVALAGLLAAGPAAAQSVGSAIDQPTAGTLPAGTSTVKGADGADRATGRVAPPSALAPSTDVMADGKGGGGTVDPVEHLPDSMRRTK
jgi:hypothetical protein